MRDCKGVKRLIDPALALIGVEPTDEEVEKRTVLKTTEAALGLQLAFLFVYPILLTPFSFCLLLLLLLYFCWVGRKRSPSRSCKSYLDCSIRDNRKYKNLVYTCL